MAARILSISTFPLASSPSDNSKSTKSSSLSLFGSFKPEALVSSLLGSQLSLSKPSIQKYRRSSVMLVATSNLPAIRERALTETPMPKWSARAIRSFAMGELECRKMKYGKTGTEAILMGILVEGTSDAAKFLRANGITLFKVRDECVNLLGKGEMAHHPPEHPPLTEQIQSALNWAVDEKLKSVMSTSSTSGGGGPPPHGGGSGGPCGACKFLRRKCVPGCIFAPYFDSEQGAGHFAAVHKVFGASNVSKLLLHIPVHKRLDAVVTICYEAQARLRDPVYGCVSHIFALQQQVVNLQAELSYLQAHLATLELPSPPPPPPTLVTPPPLSISDLPSASTIPPTFDLSTLFDPLIQPPWTLQQRQLDIRQFAAGRNPPENPIHVGGGGDLQALARELLHRHRMAGSAQPPTATSTPPPPPPPPSTSL